MYTYQDYLKIENSDSARMQFILSAINDYKNSDNYKTAIDAKEYYAYKNVTITEYQKLLYTVTGKAIPDNFSANYKLKSNFFHRFVTQECQYLLGNGVGWNNPDTEMKLGTKGKVFDTQLQIAAKNALIGGAAYCFWNVDHIDVFKADEFVPIYDEENGSIKIGIRFWQLNNLKPLRATLYEEDGCTDFIWDEAGEGKIYNPKRAYKINIVSSEADGSEIYDYSNYESFPIVPLYANPQKQSELIGLRENIDCYDLIKSGYANTVDEASYIYWAIENAGGMDDIDLATFVERMKTVHAAVLEDENARAEAHTIEAPYQSRESLLQRLRADLYEDAMCVDTKNIANGAVNTTQIKAAYEPLNSKADDFEYCMIECIQGILSLAGIDDYPTFTRSAIVNTQEEIQTVLSAGSFLSSDYITEKILTLLGDGDKIDFILNQKDEEEAERFVNEEGQSETANREEAEEDGEELEQGI